MNGSGRPAAARTGLHPGLLSLASAIIVVAALYFAREVLIPVALAVVLSFLLGPLVLRLQRWGVHRVVAVTLTLLMVFGATGLVGWFVAGQVQALAAALPEYRVSIREKLVAARHTLEPSLNASQAVADLGADLAPTETAARSRDDVQAVRVVERPPDTWEILAGVLSPTLSILVTTGMVLVLAFIMLLRRGDLRDRLIRLAGDGQIVVTTKALNETAQRVSSYLGRLLLLNGIHGTAMALGLWALGVPNALLWGALAALLRFIPYLGPWIAAAFPVLTAFATSAGWTDPLLVIGLIVVLELISNLILEPWVYARGTGISPLALLVSMLFWTWLWGPVGLMLSTPFTVCLVVMGKHVPQLNWLYLLVSDEPGLSAPERLYQRLLAGEQDQAWEVIEADLKSRPLHEVYDLSVVPALTMAERDRARGTLDTEARQRVEDSLGLLIDEAGESPVVQPATSTDAEHSANAADAAKAAVASDAAVDGAAASLPPTTDLRVLVIPGRDAIDALAATMARQVFEREGLSVTLAPAGQISGETLEALAQSNVHVACLSAVPPSRFLQVRYLCKRIAALHPELPIVVGLWGLPDDAQAAAARLPALDQVHLVRSLDEARALVRRLAETVEGRQQAGMAAGIRRDEPKTQLVR